MVHGGLSMESQGVADGTKASERRCFCNVFSLEWLLLSKMMTFYGKGRCDCGVVDLMLV